MKNDRFIDMQAEITGYRFWIVWFLVLAAIFIIHWQTLVISPKVNSDEVTIIEYGRLILQPHSDWSLNWWIPAGRPVILFSYLGGLLQETALRFGNFSITGARATSLLGAMIAATLALGWLLARNVPKMAAWFISLIFLLDPLYVSSYRGGRVDCWAMALCFASCWILRRLISSIKNNRFFTLMIGFAGFLTTSAFFIWPSAVILYPLVILELVILIVNGQAGHRNLQKALLEIVAFIAGIVLAMILLIIPILPHIKRIFNDLLLVSNMGVGGENFLQRFSRLLPTKDNIMIIAASYKLTPIFPIAALFAAVYRRDKPLILATLAAYAFILVTGAYWLRALYILPYFLALIGGIYNSPPSYIQDNIYMRVGPVILILLLLWSAAISLILRPAIALNQKEGRNPSILLSAASSSVGPAAHRVLDCTQNRDFYFAGRLFGWKMYLPFSSRILFSYDNNTVKKFLKRVDYAIFDIETSEKTNNLLQKAGLRFKKRIADMPKKSNLGKDRNNPAYRLAVLLKRQSSYGPYWLYTR